MKKQIHIALAEDHLLFRQGLLSMLKDYEDIKVLFDVGDGKEVMEKLKTNKPDILLLDIEMPILKGDEVMDKIKQKYPQIKVIVVSQYTQESYVIEFIKKGATSFLSKYSDIEKIVDAIYSVYKNGYYFDSRVSEAMARLIATVPSSNAIMFPGVHLTERELEIIKLIYFGKASKEIADILSISRKTVDNHRFAIMKKTGSKNSLELINYVVRNNIIKF